MAGPGQPPGSADRGVWGRSPAQRDDGNGTDARPTHYAVIPLLKVTTHGIASALGHQRSPVRLILNAGCRPGTPPRGHRRPRAARPLAGSHPTFAETAQPSARQNTCGCCTVPLLGAARGAVQCRAAACSPGAARGPGVGSRLCSHCCLHARKHCWTGAPVTSAVVPLRLPEVSPGPGPVAAGLRCAGRGGVAGRCGGTGRRVRPAAERPAPGGRRRGRP